MANTNHNQIITLADNPLPQKRRVVRTTYNTKWSKVFKDVQDTGKRQELISSDGLWTHGQVAGVSQTAKRWSNRNGFGKIKIQTRAVRLTTSGPRHEQYAFRIWVTVPTPKTQPVVDSDVQRLIDQILAS